MNVLKKMAIGTSALLLLSCGTASASAFHRLPPSAKVYELKGSSAKIPVTQISKIKADGAWQIVLTQGSAPSVTLSYDAALADKLEAGTSSGGALYLSHKKGAFKNNNRKAQHTAYITVTDLREIDLSGASKAETKNTIICAGEFELDLSGASNGKDLKIRAKDISIDLSGASDLELSLDASGEAEIDLSGASTGIITLLKLMREVSIDLSGASDLKLTGSAQKAEVDASGASDLKGQGFSATDADIEASGASDVSMEVKGTLEVEASGSSDVIISGKPAIRRNDTGKSSTLIVK